MDNFSDLKLAGYLTENNIDLIIEQFLSSKSQETHITHNELIKEVVERSKDRFVRQMAKL
jgi:hypothetical protein